MTKAEVENESSKKKVAKKQKGIAGKFTPKGNYYELDPSMPLFTDKQVDKIAVFFTLQKD